MIADRLSNLACYDRLLGYTKEIQEFVVKAEKENLPAGKYEIDGEKLFALIQEYETTPKEAGHYMESHKLYADLQYIVKGEEIIYWDMADELTVKEDRTPGADILFYELRPDMGGTLLSEGCFGIYLPQDAHMPCVAAAQPAACRKIVFKILL